MIAVGHIDCGIFYLKDKTPYEELGGEFLINRKKDIKVTRLIKRLKDFGVDVKLKQVS